MNGSTLTSPISMRSFLFGEDNETGVRTSTQTRSERDTAIAVGQLLNEHEVAKSALAGVRRLPAASLNAIDREIGSVLDGLLNQDLGDVLVSCWRKHRQLRDAARRTLDHPGEEEVVCLAHHRATATYSPHVDLYVDEMRINTLEFELTVVLEATGVAAVITRGDVVALRGGDCLATVTLTLEGATLMQRQRRFEPGLVVRLKRGLPLLDKAGARLPAAEPEVPRQHTA